MTTKHLIPFIIHLLLIFILASMVSGVKVTETATTPTETTVIFVADISASNKAMNEEMNTFMKDLMANSDEDLTNFGIVMFAKNIIDVVEPDDFASHIRGKEDYLILNDKPNEEEIGATNIMYAIEEAVSILEENAYKKHHKRIVLLSDGMQTDGNAFSAAKALAEKDIRLDASYFNLASTNKKEVQIVSLTTNGKVEVDGNVTVQLVVKSTTYQKDAKITIYDDGNVKEGTNEIDPVVHYQTLEKGTTAFTVTYKPDVSGINTLRAELSVGSVDKDGNNFYDVVAQNNTLYSWYTMTAKGKILAVDGDGSQLKQINAALEAGGINLGDYDLFTTVPESFPKTLEEMLLYDQIVLMNVDFNNPNKRYRMPASSAENLERYVEEVGRGLLVTCGDNAYNKAQAGEEDVTYKDSPIEHFLPVNLNIDDEKQTVAIVLVIDLSSSMNADMGNEETRYEVVLKAAQNAVRLDSFANTDYVGIVLFDQDSKVAVDMQMIGDAANREKICEKIKHEFDHYYYYYYLDANGKETEVPVVQGSDYLLKEEYKKDGYTVPAGLNDSRVHKYNKTYIKAFGTSYKWAIQEASDMLSRTGNTTRLDVKQIILMSDGAPNDKGSGYDGIVERLAKGGTVTSSVAIGDVNADGVKELSSIAAIGKGTYEKVKNADELSDNILATAEMIKGKYLNERDVLPKADLTTSSKVLVGVRDYEILHGYYGTSIKPGAELVIYVDNLKPLYAEWTYGLGNVSVFMSDLGSDWTENLFDDTDGVKSLRLVQNILLAPLNKDVQSTGLDVSSERNDTNATITVNTYKDIRDGEKLRAFVTDKDGNLIGNYVLQRAASRKYRVNIEGIDPVATYVIKLSLTDDNYEELNLKDTRTFAIVGYYDDEYDVFADGGEAVMMGIAANGGGAVMKNDELNLFYADEKDEFQIINYNIQSPAAIVALILFILDIFFRSFIFKRKKDDSAMTEEERTASMRGR